MTSVCDLERLEDFVADALSSDDGAGVEVHVANCANCRSEVAWLRSEKELFERRARQAPRLPPSLLEGTLAAIARPATVTPRLSNGAAAVAIGLAGAVALAAGMGWLITRVPTPVAPVVAGNERSRLDEAVDALDRAEDSYQKAANLLEAEYASGRPKLDEATASHYDELLSTARMRLAVARHAAGTDPDERFRVIDGYAQYVRTLRNAVYEIPEVNP